MVIKLYYDAQLLDQHSPCLNGKESSEIIIMHYVTTDNITMMNHATYCDKYREWILSSINEITCATCPCKSCGSKVCTYKLFTPMVMLALIILTASQPENWIRYFMVHCEFRVTLFWVFKWPAQPVYQSLHKYTGWYSRRFQAKNVLNQKSLSKTKSYPFMYAYHVLCNYDTPTRDPKLVITFD